VQAAEEALRQAEESYRAGLATNLERLTAQDAVLTAQLQLTSELFDHKVFYLTLLRAIGGLGTRLPGEAQAPGGPAAEPELRLPATVPAATQPTTRPIVQ
jgi:outer membrane protein TolC